MARIDGVVAGIVKSLDDPQKLGRIQVTFDWMDDAPQSYWARVAAPMAGQRRGMFIQPEMGDEVLVAFDHGDVSHPYVIGYCWSSVDEPPYSADHDTRGIVTVLGHQLTFRDRAGSGKITLATPNGYTLELDEGGKKVMLSTQTGIQLELDDTTQHALISLPTGSGFELAPSGCTLNVVGTLNVTATAATITAPILTLDASIVSIAGSLIVGGPVLTPAVVAQSYTPGVGNIW